MDNDFNKIALWVVMFMLILFCYWQSERISGLEDRIAYYDKGFDNAYWKIIQLKDDKTGEVKYFDIMIKGPVEPVEYEP